ncbi:hypothetical protein [Macrococcoides canis]|uniref:hypothetical protein n=1 Tax=Macrococcoides canis TaxID=1855823 RepID=UPI0020B8B87F|nr:hypothetical protein [Macrococcus canis]UTH12033.1 hypothetical protein KFV10_02675 [Macrococcus canis]
MQNFIETIKYIYSDDEDKPEIYEIAYGVVNLSIAAALSTIGYAILISIFG